MTIQDYIDSNEAYLERLKQIRNREKEHLSDVDFVFFAKRFDGLMSKIESQLNVAKIINEGNSNSFLVSCGAVNRGAVVLGTHMSVIDYSVVLTHYGNDLGSAFRDSQTYPRQITQNTISFRNDATTLNYPTSIAFAMPA